MKRKIEKAIFLDIDGVLSTGWGQNKRRSKWFDENGYPFDPHCVKVLNRILKVSGAEIILSSDWRFNYSDLEKLNQLFKFNNVSKSPIDTTILKYLGREEEVETYVRENEIKDFVILDDISLTCFPSNFVWVNPGTGLTKEYILPILDVLNVKNDKSEKLLQKEHKEITNISKFLSLVLRHKPEEIGISLDKNGWTSTNTLLRKCSERGINLDFEKLLMIVEKNDKKRFAFSSSFAKIRAVQGHSVKVALDIPPSVPPELLFHGTSSDFLQSIKKEGLLKGQRTHVHLSPNYETALQVSKRRKNSIILAIKSGEMQRQGFTFYHTSNNVWLVENVPSQFINFASYN